MKRSTKLTWVFVNIIFCVLLFSCKNFFNNESFLNELENAIKYVNTDPFTVRFSTEGGKISPSGDYSVKPGDKIQLIFNPESDKCFINWEVFAGDTLLSVEELSNYIHFDNLDEIETSIQILKKADNLKIQAKTVTRPNIVSATPLYDDEGAYRDRRITIMFDQYLDRDSIYFSKEELIEAGVWDSAANCVKSGYTLLDKNGDKKYFGYQNTGDDNSIVWKVATITKRTDKSANLLKCYECPEFDMYDTSVLRILSKTEVLQMPPVNADILVNIKTNFGVQEKSVTGAKKLVSLNSAYAWSYLTNSEYDNKAPIITELILYTVNPGDEDYTTIQNNEKLYLRDNDNKVNSIDIKTLIEKKPAEENNYLKYNLSQGKMWIKAQVNDIGSGVKSLKGEITKVDTDLYPCNEEKKIPYVAYTAKLNAVGPNSFVHSTDDNGEFFDVSGLQEDGLYRLTFTATDNNEKDCTEETYFFIDNKAPTLKTNITECRKEAGKTTLSYALNEPDYWKAEIYTQKLPENTNTLQTWEVNTAETVLRPSNYKSGEAFGNEVTGLESNKLEAGNKYQHKVVLIDYSGNKSDPIDVDIDNTPPNIPVVYVGGMNEGLRISTDCSYDKDIDYVEISGTDSIKLESVREKGVYAAKFTNKTNGVNYSYSVQTTDYAGNKSPITTVSGMPGIKVGYYCYLINDKDIIFSQNILNGGKNLVGIVIANGHYSDSWITGETVRIMDLKLHNSTPPTVVYDHNKGSVPSAIDDEENDGFRVYKNVKANNYFDRCPRYKYLYEEVNNFDKNPIIWYLPSLNEMLELNSYSGNGFSGWYQRNRINTSLSNIPETIPHMNEIPRSSEFATSTLWNNKGTPSGYTVYWLNSAYWAGYTLSGNEGISYADYLLMAQINPAY